MNRKICRTQKINLMIVDNNKSYIKTILDGKNVTGFMTDNNEVRITVNLSVYKVEET